MNDFIFFLDFIILYILGENWLSGFLYDFFVLVVKEIFLLFCIIFIVFLLWIGLYFIIILLLIKLYIK